MFIYSVLVNASYILEAWDTPVNKTDGSERQIMIIYNEQRNYIVLKKVISFMGKRENEHRVRRIGAWGWAY